MKMNYFFFFLLMASSTFLVSCDDDDDDSVPETSENIPNEAFGEYEGTFTIVGGTLPESATATVSSSSPHTITFSNGKDRISGITFVQDSNNPSAYGYVSGDINVGLSFDSSDNEWTLGVSYSEGVFGGTK